MILCLLPEVNFPLQATVLRREVGQTSGQQKARGFDRALCQCYNGGAEAGHGRSHTSVCCQMPVDDWAAQAFSDSDANMNRY
jgi:hypothetical protein